MPRFNIAGFMKSRKKKKEQMIGKSNAVSCLDKEIERKEKEAEAKRAKLRRLNEKVN